MPQEILEKVQVPAQFPQHPLQDLYNAVDVTFQGEKYHKKEENLTQWSSIINKGDLFKYEADRDNGLSRYSSTRDLLETRFESSEEEVWIARRRTALDVLLGWIYTLLELDRRRQWPFSFSESGGRFLLTSRDCP